MKLKLPDVSSRYGAPMGRPNLLPESELTNPLYLQRVPFVDLCYDRGGAYWGMPANLYCAFSDECRIFVRGNSRSEAKSKVLAILPTATFHR